MGEMIMKATKRIVIAVAVIAIAKLLVSIADYNYQWAVEHDIPIEENRAIPKKFW